MSRKKTYQGRSLAELGQAPDDALITIAEWCHWQQISHSEYFRRRKLGLLPNPKRYGPQTMRHTMGQLRECQASMEAMGE
ncbi:MAG: hypothetical protein AB2697_21335 [Candidatus Thiodiazotropha endolucinida]